MAYLYDRLLSAEPAELLVIRAALLPHRDELAAANVADCRGSGGGQGRRFRAALRLGGL